MMHRRKPGVSAFTRHFKTLVFLLNRGTLLCKQESKHAENGLFIPNMNETLNPDLKIAIYHINGRIRDQ